MANPAGVVSACPGTVVPASGAMLSARRNGMDGQHFDQFARALATAASRRRLLKTLVGGTAGGLLALPWARSTSAQCSWSGTFEAPFNGDISMTLNEAGGQVTGNYTFTQDNAVRNGS